MKKAFIYLSMCLFISNMYAIGAYEDPADIVADMNSADAKELKIYTENSKKMWDKTQKRISGEEAASVGNEKKTIYFQDLNAPSTCESLEALKCPPLKPEYRAKFRVATEYIDPLRGEVKCSVFDLDKTNGLVIKENLIVPFHKNLVMDKDLYEESKIFSRGSCKRYYDPKLNPDNSDKIDSARSMIYEKQNELKNMEMKYTVDYAAGAGEQYLDLGDWLDALSTMDSEKIDIETTLAQWEVKLRDGYTIEPNTLIIDEWEGDIQDLLRYYNENITSDEMDQEIKNRVRLDQTNKIVANSQYVMWLDFFTNSDETIRDVLVYILFAIIGWNIAINYGFSALTNKFGSQSGDNENHLARIGFPVLMFFSLFVGSSEQLNIRIGNGVEETVKELEVKTFRIQTFVRYVYGLANKSSDELAKQAIKSYLKGLNATSGVGTVEMLDSLASEKKVLEKEINTLVEVHKTCTDIYNIGALQGYMNRYKEATLANTNAAKLQNDVHWSSDVTNFIGYTSSKAGYGTAQSKTATRTDFGELEINPFPMSEREVSQIRKKSNINLYSEVSRGGVMKKGFVKSGNFNKDFILLSGCYYNKKKMLRNQGRQQELEAKIEVLTNPDRYNTKVEHLKIIHDMMWKNYAELGYISIAFLPSTSVLVDSGNTLGDGQLRKEIIDETSDSGVLKDLATGVPLMTLFGGHQVAQMINSVGSTIANGAVETFPVVKPLKKALKALYSQDNSQPGIVSYLLASKVISAMLEALVLVVLISGSLLAFLILAIQKLWAFVATIFVSAHLFSANQQEKVGSSLAKILNLSFKSILLVVSVFVAIYSISLLDTLQAILINDFFNNMETIQNAELANKAFNEYLPTFHYVYTWLSQSFTKYSYIGVTSAGFIVVKIYLAYHIIFKLPEFFYELLESQAVNASSQISEVIQDANQRQELKGL